MNLPYEEKRPVGIEIYASHGNPQLTALVPSSILTISDGTWDELFAATDRLASDLRGQGKSVYQIPIGGSSPLGVYAFVQAAEEVKETGIEFDWIVTSSSSGSTQTGLTYGFRDHLTQVLGIAADPEPEFLDDVVALGQQFASRFGVEPLDRSRFLIDKNFVGNGYGVTDKATLGTIRWLVQTEGIFLDPIYSGKAFRGLAQLATEEALNGRVLFWHTGGQPTLFGLNSEALFSI
jgi:1-aminocyclopropane-1-carboxylate deaminase/D-cysteine desulfhydrase-like pyridoxal-dependent ACC family enzyme